MNNWNEKNIKELFALPLFELINQAYLIHKQNFKEADMELCTLVNLKTGACPEDCGYCSQSGHYKTGVKPEKLFDVEAVLIQAENAKKSGAKRLCMGAAWRNPPKRDFPKVLEIIKQVKAMGLETCVTLGMLDTEQASELKAAGLDYYNHNLDTSPEHYKNITTTRTYQDRIDTLHRVKEADINICCGGIMGMGESEADRISFLLQLAALPQPLKSIPINKLIPIKGTPLENSKEIDNFDFIKMIAVTRIMFPHSRVRLSAGRTSMSDEMQAWCFMAGANSMWVGDVLLTAANPSEEHDFSLLKKLGIRHNEIAIEA